MDSPILGFCEGCGQVNITCVHQTGPGPGEHYNLIKKSMCGPVRHEDTVECKLAAIREASKHSFPIEGILDG